MKKADFLKAVTHEVETLKQMATAEELTKLNLETFNPKYADRCIYGQLTGSCTSVRAKELMDNACIIVTNDKVEDIETFDGKTYREASKFINGKNTGQGWKDDGGHNGLFYSSRNYSHLSALEAYILLRDAKVQHIIEFLKGEVETLSL